MNGDFPALAQRIRVPLGFLLGVLFVLFSRPTPVLAAVGLSVALLGLGLRLWAAGCIEKSRELEVSGPYQYTRNPLYLGSFILGAGACIAAANVWLIAIFVGLFWCVYGPVMKREEEEMLKLFPQRFPEYRCAVPLFVPRLTKPGSLPAGSVELSLEGQNRRLGDATPRPEIGFRWSRVLRNREYNAVVGFLGIFSWICFRLWKN
ncbi:MAG TPA: isoprenylcysteine carboxylmethyltransferase family protein [Acidobacteriota bacterium]|jgi:protein-S-isoprenylcysteine O-methyltransferase Ste14